MTLGRNYIFNYYTAHIIYSKLIQRIKITKFIDGAINTQHTKTQ